MQPDRQLVIVGFWLSLFVPIAFAQNHAELIVHNARVTTLDEQRPDATAVAVKDGLFLAVGGKDDVMKHRGPGTRLLARERFTLVSR